jgi:homoserine dehydrogenase
MREVRVAFIGFGNVNQAFVRLFIQKIKSLERFNVEIRFVGVATQHHGSAINQAGIEPLIKAPRLLLTRN